MQTRAEAFQAKMSPERMLDLAGVGQALQWGDPLTAPVLRAVALLLEERQADIEEVANRVSAATLGVMNALIAYLQAQEAMTFRFPQEMVDAAADGDFTSCREHDSVELGVRADE